MDSDPATPQRATVTPVRPDTENDAEIEWEQQPEQLTTREVAAIFGKSAANIRARASRGDFGNTVNGEDGLPRYDRGRVRALYERVTRREAQTRLVTNLHGVAPSTHLSTYTPTLATALTELQAQHREQVALWAGRLEDAREAAQQAREEAQELRFLLREREETTRATLSHMDMLHAENVSQLREALAQEKARTAEAVAAQTAASVRPPEAPAAPQQKPSFWRKLFGS